MRVSLEEHLADYARSAGSALLAAKLLGVPAPLEPTGLWVGRFAATLLGGRDGLRGVDLARWCLLLCMTNTDLVTRVSNEAREQLSGVCPSGASVDAVRAFLARAACAVGQADAWCDRAAACRGERTLAADAVVLELIEDSSAYGKALVTGMLPAASTRCSDGNSTASSASCMWAWWHPDARGQLPGVVKALALAALVAAIPDVERPAGGTSLTGGTRLEHHPALPAMVAEPLVRSLVSATVADDRVISKQRAVLPLVPLDTAVDLAPLGSLAAQRLVRWLPWAACVAWRAEGAWATLSDDPPVRARHGNVGVEVEIVGGFRALAGLLGPTTRAPAEELRKAVLAMAAVHLDWQGPSGMGRDALLGLHPGLRPAPGRPRCIFLRLSEPWTPGLVHQLPQRRRRLVPVVRDLPPVPAGLSPRLHSAVARLELLAILELRTLARLVVREGGARLDWKGLGARAGLRSCQVDRVLELWTGGDQVEPRWECLHGELWHLARDGVMAAARAFIEDAGVRELKGAQAGRARARNKRRRGRS